MTDEIKLTRLSKAAREFNVGISTIVEFLHKKGFDLDPNPNTKIPHEAYLLLLKEYSGDISVKKESEKLMLKDLHRKKETVSIDDMGEKIITEENGSEEEVLVKDVLGSQKVVDIKTEIKKPDIKLVGKIDLEKTVKPKTEKPEKPKETSEKSEEKEALAPEKPETKKPSETKEVTPPVEEGAEEKPASDIEIHIVGKIDLDDVEKETKKDKKDKKDKTTAASAEEKDADERIQQQEETAEVKEEKADEVHAKLSDKDQAEEEVAAEVAGQKDPVSVYKTEVKKLSGLTVVGKIDLPVEEKKKSGGPPPEKSDDADSRRRKKRKRIIKEKEQVTVAKPVQPERREKPGKKVQRKRPVRAEVDEEEVQKQIKETLARLTTKGKSKGSRYRREKREAISQRHREFEDRIEQEKNIIKVTEFVSVNELASMMNIPVTEIISTCMNLGLFVSINQRLDAETMALLADEFGYKVEFVSAELLEAVKEEEDAEENLRPRPPIVTVMGHVDHGKTKLLDYIRRTNVIAGEAGGITQHIGAYNVVLDDGRQITFLDTPGHEAFTAMRARGAQITDIAIIVVAADDGVMPQTVEAINHASAAGVPIVFAINKIDKPSANPDKLKESLANMNYLVEDWGGKYQSQEISAKNGINIELLLDKVLLEAELLELKANPNKPATGTVIESSLDKGRGFTATVLVKSGTLKVGDIMLAGSCFGHVKAMYNERGNRIDIAGPSMPALILGLNGAPQAGDKFNIMENDREAKEIATKRAQLQREQGLRTQKHITLDEIGRRIAIGNFQELNIIVKGDVDGSVEALSDSLIKLSTPEIQLNVIHKAVGQISESDVLLAAASNAIIVGFQVRPSMNARKLAEKEEIDVRLYSIIYNAIEEIKSAMEGMLSPEVREDIVATLEIREIFKVTKVGTVAGCYVKEGKITRNTKVRVIRDGIVIYTGELGSLKRFKDDVKEVVGGYECGLNISNFNDIKAGDIIEGYQEVEIRKTL